MPEINLHVANRTGCIEVITGPMFSGKTEDLIQRIRRSRLANQTVVIFKPSVDTRHSKTRIVSRKSAVCVECGNTAHYSYRHSKEGPQIFPGEKDKYIPLCAS